MISGLLGKKIGMTHYFGGEAQLVPVTVLEVGPCVVTQVKTTLSDGYDAVQVGFGHAKQLTKPKRGHLKDSGDLRHLREFKASDMTAHQVGERLDVSEFRPGEFVDVIGTSKGKGFQGVVRRHGYAGGPKTHGQGDRQRSPGSIGAGTFPGRVFKGKAMPGRMGGKRITVQHLRVEKVDVERNLLLLRGAVPGAPNGLLAVRHQEMDEAKLPPRVDLSAVAELEPQDAPAADQVVEDEVVAEAPAEEAPTAEAQAPVAEDAPAEDASTEAEPPEAEEAAPDAAEAAPDDAAPDDGEEEAKS